MNNSSGPHALYACRLLLIALICAIATALVPAQTFYGSIVGTVTDQSGATISGANVTLTNTGTAERRTGQTDNSGSYQFVNLVPGVYRIDVETKGFKHLTREQIQVEVQSAVRLDWALQVGDIGQVVEVTAERRYCKPKLPLWARWSTRAPSSRCRSTAGTC
jgi:hypothetical protein